MSGLASNVSSDAMEYVRLRPRLTSLRNEHAIQLVRSHTYPLNARVRMVHEHIMRGYSAAGIVGSVAVLDNERKLVALDELLLPVLARTNNELLILDMHDPLVRDPAVTEVLDRQLTFEPLNPMVLEGIPSDLTRELQARCVKYFPRLRLEVTAPQGVTLDDNHTNRYYMNLWSAATRGHPCLIVVPRHARELQITLAPGITLSLGSEHYSFDESDNLVIGSQVLDALARFSEQQSVTAQTLAPLIDLLDAEGQAKARDMQGAELIAHLAATFKRAPQHLAQVLHSLATLPPVRRGETLAQRLAVAGVHSHGLNNAAQHVALRQQRATWASRGRRAASAMAQDTLRKLNVLRIWAIKAVLWLYQNNIASILTYTVVATGVSQALERETNVIYLLWVYTLVAVVAGILQARKRVNIIEQLVLFAYPQVYPVGDTPAEVLHAVPAASVRAAVASTPDNEPVSCDTIVQDMVVRPPWWQVAAICVGSLDPVSYKEWAKQVRERRSLAYDAARLAVTKQQQIGL